MPAITLPDGSVRRFDAPVTGTTLAADIGPGLARAALAMKADGALMDLARPIVEEGAPDDETIRRSALEMASGAWEQRATIDTQVERLAPQWPPRRQPGVDRNLIRLAVWELTHSDTPPKVVLDEAIELAKNFSTENSPAFINGVLDAIHRQTQAAGS